MFTAGKSEPNATWQGLAGYVNYRFDDRWKSTIRAEYFDDEQGYRTGVPQIWRELTTTIGYVPLDSIELRGEFRIDASDIKAFQSTSGNPAHDQHSIALQAILKY